MKKNNVKVEIIVHLECKNGLNLNLEEMVKYYFSGNKEYNI